jgi:hypothetical protein
MARTLGVLSMLGLVACGNAIGDTGAAGSADQVSDGTATSNTSALKVLEADEAAGKLVLTYEGRGSIIRYELRVGNAMERPPSAAELTKDPELPRYEVDARVMDAAGQTFVMQMAADRFMDPTWSTAPLENVDVAWQARLRACAGCRRTDTCELSTSCVTGGCLTQYYWSSGCSSHNCDDDGDQARAIWTNKAQNQRAGMSNNCTLNFNALGVCTERGYG